MKSGMYGGFLHEHQRGFCDQWYNMHAISADTGFQIEQIRARFVAIPTTVPYGVQFIGNYDKLSIMQYNMLRNWFMPAEANPCIRNDIFDLSDGDKSGAGQLYGKTPIPLPGQAKIANTAEIRSALMALVTDVQHNVAAKEAVARAHFEAADVFKEQISKPRKECTSRGLGINCYDKVPDSDEVSISMKQKNSEVKQYFDDAAAARNDKAKLQRLLDAYDALSKLE